MSQVKLVRGEGGRCELQGELSFATVPGLLAQHDDLFAEQPSVTIDLHNVERSDSAGVALLVEWMNQAWQQQRELRFLNIPEQMLSIARVSGLDHILPFSRDPV